MTVLQAAGSWKECWACWEASAPQMPQIAWVLACVHMCRQSSQPFGPGGACWVSHACPLRTPDPCHRRSPRSSAAHAVLVLLNGPCCTLRPSSSALGHMHLRSIQLLSVHGRDDAARCCRWAAPAFLGSVEVGVEDTQALLYAGRGGGRRAISWLIRWPARSA